MPIPINPIPKKIWMLWMSPSEVMNTSKTASEEYMDRATCKTTLEPKISDSVIDEIEKITDETLQKNRKSQLIVDKCMYRTCVLAESTNWECNVLTKREHVNRFLEEVKNHNGLGDSAVSWISNVLNSPHAGMAHKSDLIRLVLLYMHGGVWMDASTVPLDSFDWITNLNSELVLPYVGPDQVAQWLLQEISQKYDEDNFDNFQQFLDTEFKKNIVWGTLAKVQPFVPENYFIACIQGNRVIRNVIDELQTMWGYILSKSDSSEKVIENIRQYMMDIVYAGDKLFRYKKYQDMLDCSSDTPQINTPSFLVSNSTSMSPLTSLSISGGKSKSKSKSNSLRNRKYKGGEICRLKATFQSILGDKMKTALNSELLKNMWGDGYLFNYIQIYHAIKKTYPDCCVNMQEQYTSTPEQITQGSLDEEDKDKIQELTDKYYTPICQKIYDTPESPLNTSFNRCSDYAYVENGIKRIYFVSASLIRFFKWANTLNERLTLKNTVYDKVLNPPPISPTEVVEYLKQNNQHFVKLGSWTRVPSYEMVMKIFKILEKQSLSGGRRMSFKKMTVTQLKALCKNRHLKGYSSKTKEELILLLQSKSKSKTKSKV